MIVLQPELVKPISDFPKIKKKREDKISPLFFIDNRQKF
jgi:hypothetical protein